LDSSLVSNENFSETLWPSGWPRPGNMSQNNPKTASLMTSVTNNPHPNQKIYFRVESTRQADPFEPLNSSLTQSVEELGVGKATENCCSLGWNQSM